MLTPQYSLDINDEIIIDNFAGGGGASTGIELGLGRHVDVAINHDPEAVSMHQANHPQTRHYCESVWEVNPREVHPGRKIGLLWLSPDCKHFSKAKGGKPVEKKIRGLAWVALRWAAVRKPRVIMLENVEEFVTWGPLVEDAEGNMRPCQKRKGREFNAFVNALRRQGYLTVAGEIYAIVDIGLRMLAPRELFRAQGFPENYIIDRGLVIDEEGNILWKPLTKSAQVRMCGNSVCPPLAAALVRANCANMIVSKTDKKIGHIRQNVEVAA